MTENSPFYLKDSFGNDKELINSDTTETETETETATNTNTTSSFTESDFDTDSDSDVSSLTTSESEQSSDYERGTVNCGDDRQIKKARELIRERLPSEIVFPNEGNIPNYEAIFKHFTREGKLFRKDVIKICKLVQKTLKKEPNLLRISSPVLIFGDLHGQFFDLVSIMKAIEPCKENENHFLFLGDYVDRGNYGIEILLYLFALKISQPNACFILRGKHF
ncbi:phosphoprotein phosphatase activity protein [Anaeramoeba flamelloides]|uniref:Phosphoprotein phosphatase activity protein n=1 Tax=Anaeramoeba flamelloides TaxID=1746091 RepID=A0AAV8ACF4_9EUKA|nr:phosphoprotein phosphatase activity protein [Anaeramoeba flamelloides]